MLKLPSLEELLEDQGIALPIKKRIEDLNLPPSSTYREPAPIIGSALSIIQAFSPLDELHTEELAYIYTFKDKSDRLKAFRVLSIRYLERSNPWIDFPFQDPKAQIKKIWYPKTDTSRAYEGEKRKMERNLELRFLNLEGEVEPSIPRTARSKDPEQCMRRIAESINQVRRRKKVPTIEVIFDSSDNGDKDAESKKMSDKAKKQKIVSLASRDQFIARTRALQMKTSHNNGKLLPEYFDIFNVLRMDELLHIFGKDRIEERWTLFKNALRPHFESELSMPKKNQKSLYSQSLSKKPRVRGPADIETMINKDLKIFFENLDSEISKLVIRANKKHAETENKLLQRLAVVMVDMKRLAVWKNSLRPREKENGNRQIRTEVNGGDIHADERISVKQNENTKQSRKFTKPSEHVFEKKVKPSLPPLGQRKIKKPSSVLPMYVPLNDTGQETNLPLVKTKPNEHKKFDNSRSFLRRNKIQNASKFPPISDSHRKCRRKPFTVYINGM